MYRKAWYILLVWTMATFFFFILTGVAISMFSPGPSEQQTMQWMMGYMQAMHTSLMAWTMESHGEVNQLLNRTGALVFPAMFGGAAIGVLLKMRRLRNER